MAANLNRNCYITDKYFGNTPQMNHNDGFACGRCGNKEIFLLSCKCALKKPKQQNMCCRVV